MKIEANTILLVTTILLLVAILFYRLGLSRWGLPSGRNSFVILSIALIGAGSFFFYKNYGRVFGWGDLSYCKIPLQELIEMYKADESDREILLLEKGFWALPVDDTSVFSCSNQGLEAETYETTVMFEKKTNQYRSMLYAMRKLKYYKAFRDEIAEFKNPDQPNTYKVEDDLYIIDYGYLEKSQIFQVVFTTNLRDTAYSYHK